MLDSEKRFETSIDRANSRANDYMSQLGRDGPKRVAAILTILSIGEKKSIAYQKAVLAAAELALEQSSCLLDIDSLHFEEP